MTTPSAPPGVTQQSPHAAISNLIVRLTREYTGRGPTKARTMIADDVVTVVLEDTLTRGERSLVEDGRSGHVLEMRSAFQDTMRQEMTEGVALILGRPVRALLSANHVNPDVGVETFLLGPANGADLADVTVAVSGVDGSHAGALHEVQY
jgi:uncharacterized protein YbcI